MMGSRLEELLKKLSDVQEEVKQEKVAEEKVEEEEGFIKLSHEDLELLQSIGAAYIQGLLEGVGLMKEAQEESMGEATETPEVVDLDGDGVPDHIVANSEDIVEELAQMVEEGEISAEEAQAIAEMVADQLAAQEEGQEKEAADIKGTLSSIIGAAKSKAKKAGSVAKTVGSYVSGHALGKELATSYKAGKAAWPESNSILRTLRALKAGNISGADWKERARFAGKVLLPIGFYGGLSAGAVAGYKKIRGEK